MSEDLPPQNTTPVAFWGLWGTPLSKAFCREILAGRISVPDIARTIVDTVYGTSYVKLGELLMQRLGLHGEAERQRTKAIAREVFRDKPELERLVFELIQKEHDAFADMLDEWAQHRAGSHDVQPAEVLREIAELLRWTARRH